MKGLIIALATVATPASADVQRIGEIEIEGLGEVFFAFDSARVEGAGPAVDTIASWAKAHPGMSIVLDGHTDSVGDPAYNVGLALRRADRLRARLTARGVDADRILIVTYGENGLRYSTNAGDRRVTVWATAAPLYAIVEQSLERGTAILWNEPVPATALVAPRASKVSIR